MIKFKLCFFIIALLISMSSVSFASNPLDGDVYKMEFPPGWKFEGEGKPVLLRGPNSELITITELSTPLAQNTDKAASAFKAIRKMTVQTLADASGSGGFVANGPISTYQHRGYGENQSAELLSISSYDVNERRYFDQYAMLHSSGAAVLLTLAGADTVEPDNSAALAAEKMLIYMVWK